MTENEAIKILYTENQCLGKANSGRCKINCGDCKENIPIAYQEKAYEVAISALKEIQQYREIGTVEECREAVEKQKAKKPKDSLKINPVIDGNGAYVDADTTIYLLCPNCEELVGIEENCDNYCRECGQKIDKESEEE